MLDLILQFDRTSKFREAQLNDEEWAREVIDLPQLERNAPPPMSQFTPEVELLTYIGESLQAVHGALVALGQGKPQHPRPLPRPRTALDRIRDERRAAHIDALANEVEAAMRRYEDMTGG